MITLALIVTLIEIFLVKLFGYFLSPEFTVYPYFWSKGMLPYLHILDQHPPFLFFGPFSLPTIITNNPNSLFVLWFLVIYFVNLIVVSSSNQRWPQKVFLLLSSWIIFSGRTLWTDVFLVLFLLLYLSASPYLAGVSMAAIILLRPTYLPLAIFLFFYRRPQKMSFFLLGLFAPLLIVAYFIYHQGLTQSLFYYVYTFNKEYYLPLANSLPTFKEVLLIFLFVSPLISTLSIKDSVLVLLMFLPAFPRFEMSHLFGASILLIFLSHKKVKNSVLYAMLIPLAVASFGLFRHPVGNFYYSPKLYQLADKINSLPPSPLLVVGESDLLYPMTNRIPPNMTYLPMLPWYIDDKSSSNKILVNLLSSPSTLVVVDRLASLSGVKIIDRFDSINKIVNIFYQPIATISSTTIYSRL